MDKKSLNLRMHQKIFVFRQHDKTRYSSTIEDYNDQAIYISLPLCQQSPLVLHKGNKVSIQLISPDHLLEFQSTVTSLSQDNIVLIGIAYPSKVNRIQLRKFVRLDVLFKVKYAHEPEPGEEPVYKTVDALNLSAGGLKIVTRENFENGKKLLLKFTLSVSKKDYDFNLSVTAKRTILMETRGRNNLYHAGVEFNDITPKERDLIVQFIFQNSNKAKFHK
jgi:c-di-GMP-binding flagellar brake protein YcgR